MNHKQNISEGGENLTEYPSNCVSLLVKEDDRSRCMYFARSTTKYCVVELSGVVHDVDRSILTRTLLA